MTFFSIVFVSPGFIKVAIGHSFDTVKIRLQCSPSGSHRGALDVLRKIVRNEGILALYKGATPQVVGCGLIDSVLMGSLHNYRLFFLRQGMSEDHPISGRQRLTLLGHGVAGLFAGLTSAVIATPFESLKVKLQLQSQKAIEDRQFKGPIDCARQIIRQQGVFGIWSGFTGSLIFRANFFWMFLSVEALMRGFSHLEISTGTANFLSGGFASFVYWGMAIPADNIKNRMLAYPYPRPYPTPSTRLDYTFSRPSFIAVARLTYSVDGVAGFYRGLAPTLIRAFPMNASALFAYEGIMRLLGAEETRH
ncbi:hypothetical protein Ac2012v2_000308 [Leucoagaricus gongylophorus]